jgi:hypothetical protein
VTGDVPVTEARIAEEAAVAGETRALTGKEASL